MRAGERGFPAEREQIEALEELVKRARRPGVRTGLHNDDVGDITRPEADELIEQLRRRLGEAKG